MRKSTSIRNPLFLISFYYLGLVAIVQLLLWLLPNYKEVLPFGGVEALLHSGAADVEIITTFVSTPDAQSFEATTLGLAIVGAILVMAPISWVYFITTRTKQIDRSFAQTMMVLPVIVAGIAMIVQNSLALAFSLAGVVAAVRFRFALEEPAMPSTYLQPLPLVLVQVLVPLVFLL